jgi:hypothetical protein
VTRPAEAPRQLRPARDPRLDFFRGLAMFIIFIAHVPGNSWFLFIPARFGFSSAAELFVFCSGVASGFAFGGQFLRLGQFAGTMRVAHRVWQVYWAHIGLFLTLTAISVLGWQATGKNYLVELGLQPFLADPAQGILRVMTLRFIPNFNDIMPLYLVLLAMIPLVMGLARVSHWLALGCLGLLWLYAHLTQLNFPANNVENTKWYFSPFAWQMLFFTGFAFAMGWLPVPRLVRGGLFRVCVVFLLVSIPLNFWAVLEAYPAIDAFRDVILPEGNQMYLHPLRYFHFLALAYVALVMVEPRRERLWQARPIILVGQQSLATFLASTSLIWVAGMVLDQTGRGALATALVNLSGFAAIVAVARIAAYFKSPPWKAAKSG